jgi:hypothetical protein
MLVASGFVNDGFQAVAFAGGAEEDPDELGGDVMADEYRAASGPLIPTLILEEQSDHIGLI